MDRPEQTDVIIIGGGPAGISAALWCADLGLSATIFEKEDELGGQLLRTFNPITNYPGVVAANGRELRDKFVEQRNNANVSWSSCDVTAANLTDKTLELSDGSLTSGKAIIIATGVRRRKLGIPGEDEFAGRGVLASGAASMDKVAGKKVAIVGGGDAAIENALLLSEKAERVVVVHRGPTFSAREEFQRRVSEQPNIDVMFGYTPTSIIGTERFKAIELRSAGNEKTVRVEAEHLLIRIGSVPNSELFREQVKLDTRGYICINSRCETNIHGVFAAGDVASPDTPTIANAAGQGAAAVKLIEKMSPMIK